MDSAVQHEAASAPKRAVCSRCQRPQRACYCAALPTDPLATQLTRVVVLQHANEQRQRKAISSVPVLAQVLESPASCSPLTEPSVVIVPVEVEGGKGERVSDALRALLEKELRPYVDAEALLVLFPHPDARTLDYNFSCQWRAQSGAATDHRRLEKRVTLVVVDGTWTEAKKIVHHSQRYWETLAAARRDKGQTFEYVCLEAGGDGATEACSSLYGELRKEPMEGCVSTLEAVAMALRVLEPEPYSDRLCDALRTAFRGMVAIQTQFQRRGRAQQREKHGGTPKPQQKSRSGTGEELGDVKKVTQSTGGQGVVKTYVFYTTQTDFRKRQRLVQEGGTRQCTRDEAIARCHEMNRTRTRGSRVSTLPFESFVRQQRDHEQQNDEPGA